MSLYFFIVLSPRCAWLLSLILKNKSVFFSGFPLLSSSYPLPTIYLLKSQFCLWRVWVWLDSASVMFSMRWSLFLVALIRSLFVPGRVPGSCVFLCQHHCLLSGSVFCDAYTQYSVSRFLNLLPLQKFFHIYLVYFYKE